MILYMAADDQIYDVYVRERWLDAGRPMENECDDEQRAISEGPVRVNERH